MNTAMSLLYTFVVLLFGAGIGWYACMRRSGKDARAIKDLRAEIQSSERVIAELRRQISSNETSIEALWKNVAAAEQAKASAEAKLEAALISANEQKIFLERVEERLTTAFQVLSDNSLKQNGKVLLDLARQSLEAVVSKTKDEWGESERSLKDILASIENTMKRPDNVKKDPTAGPENEGREILPDSPE